MQFYNPDDHASDSLDADPRADHDIAHWIVDEDGVGRWSDGWGEEGLSEEEYLNLPIEFRSMDAFAPGVVDDMELDLDDCPF